MPSRHCCAVSQVGTVQQRAEHAEELSAKLEACVCVDFSFAPITSEFIPFIHPCRSCSRGIDHLRGTAPRDGSALNPRSQLLQSNHGPLKRLHRLMGSEDSKGVPWHVIGISTYATEKSGCISHLAFEPQTMHRKRTLAAQSSCAVHSGLV